MPPLDPAEAAPVISPRRDGRPIAILVVEDNKMNRRVMTHILAPLEAEIAYAETGCEALDLCRTRTFDVVLMDIQMPRMDGVTAAIEIRAHERDAGGTSRVAIVATTANAMAHQRQIYLDAGMDECLAKPIMRAALYAILKEVLPPDDIE